jgi:two-component system chemotaxis response regulator CheB
VLAQDEGTSVVWGMPGAVVRAGFAEEELPLVELSARITARAAQTLTSR